MKKLFALLLALVMMFSLVACVQSDVENTKGTGETEKDTIATMENTVPSTEEGEDLSKRYGGTFVLDWTPGDTYDPMKTSGWKSYCWSQNVFDNIVYRDGAGNLAPGVCDFELSADKLTLKLWVREGVTFHNGDKVDIYDVKASFDRACGLVSRMKNHVVPYLVSSDVTEDKYMTLKFSEYDPTTLYYLSANQVWTVVIPKEICEKYGKDPIIDRGDAIGTGPYYVAEGSEPGVKMILKKYQAYVPTVGDWDAAAAPKMGYFDEIIVTGQYEDYNTTLMAMIQGDLNSTSYDVEFKDMWDQVPGLTLFQSNQTSVQYIHFNCVNPSVPCYDKNVRKAIAACLDYKDIMDYTQGEGSYNVDYSMMQKGPYYMEKYAAADYHGAANVELAKAYLAKSGYNGETVTIVANQGASWFPLFENRMKAAGINVVIQYMDSTSRAEFIANPEVNAYDMDLVTSAIGDYLPNTLAPNLLDTSYSNETVDGVLKDISKIPYGSEESVNKWKTCDEIIADECPSIVFGNFGARIIAFNKNIIYNCSGGIWVFWYNSYYDANAK